MARARDLTRKSVQYRALCKELQGLRHHLLPKTFEPTGQYPDRIYTRTFAYQVLTHAEFEYYFERRVEEIYRTSIGRFRTTRHTNKVLACLLAFSGLNNDAPPESKSPVQQNQQNRWDEKVKIDKRATRAANAFYKAIQDNHGIKEKNLLKLLLPIGIEVDELDDVWLASMNSFGELRGSIAHSSNSHNRTAQLPDPQIALTTVTDLAEGIKPLDELLNKLLKM